MHIFGRFSSRAPEAVYTATRLEDVRPLLTRAEAAAQDGRWVAVMLSYDAAPAFDPAMRERPAAPPATPPATLPPTALPVAWAAEFDQLSPAPAATPAPPGEPWPVFAATVDAAAFCERVRRAQEYIASGDTYQVNLTFPMQAPAAADLETWFGHLGAAQRAAYPALLDLGSHVILSLSPELFFERRGPVIRTRPMKGTIRRGRWLAEDEALARALATSSKAQAENVMIVDLLRNDVGRVAETGTVHVPALFAVEPYPTLWQLTSTVEGAIIPGTPLAAIFTALFPCGSVTGAPKIRTMEIIAELEDTPRGLYTGAIGLIEPGGDCTFSVAIRTVVVERASGVATMGVGAGITADSVPEEEYAESLLKSAFASRASAGHAQPFLLLETMRLETGTVLRLERHLRRMRDSARYFGFAWEEPRVRAAVEAEAAARTDGVWRLRLTVSSSGEPVTTCTEHADVDRGPWRVAFANAPIDDADPFLFNKTTSRHAYEVARRGRPDVDDVLLWNGRREATESTIANLVVEIHGERWTPARECGLLGGTLREELIETGAIRERVITRGEVMRAERLWLINSVRGWIEAIAVR